MIGWQNSHSTNLRHEHTTRTDDSGREVCTTCSKVVIKPITSSDDERLINAGLQRSDDRVDDPFHAPLPEQLIAMYNETHGEFPVAPYIIQVLQQAHGDDNELWYRLASKF